MKDPKAIRKAIMTAKSIASLIDPHFGRVPMPALGKFGGEEPIEEHSPMIHEVYGEPMPEHFASGGEVDDQHPYAVPNDLGLYSHAAVTAAGLPQERGTPEQFRGMLLNKGVKPAELHWGEYDYAFGDKPEVTRDEVAKHLWATMPPVEEMILGGHRSASIREKMKQKHRDELNSIWDDHSLDREDQDKLLRQTRRRHEEELRAVPYDDPYHEEYTLPGGENYREILLKHADEDKFPGVPGHFGGEPDILASLRMKDRQDAEGDKVLHLDELQSDWAQRAREHGQYSPKEFEDYLKDLEQRAAPLVAEEFGIPESTASAKMPEWTRTGYLRHHNLAEMLGEGDEYHDKWIENQSRKNSEVSEAPFIGKTEDWVSLGLKRALLEAARGGHDKLAWTTGDMQADRYPGGTPEEEAKRRAGMIHFYDKILPKALLKLAKMHDPEAEFTQSMVQHSKIDKNPFNNWEPEEEGNVSSDVWREKPAEMTALPALIITPQMRESILKKGFPAYAQGGEVEGYADGGAPDDPYAQNPNGGLMFPPEEGAARLETMQRRNALVAFGKKPDAGLPKNPRVVIPAPEGSKLPDFVTGNITFDDWRKRHEKILSDDEIHHSSNWYKNIYGNFLKYYPDPQEAKKMMRAWLVAQQNVSPAGAMNNVLMQQEQMDRGDPEHLWRAGGMPNPTAAARAVLRGQPIAGGVGQKISDFVDSAEGKNTRSWMGDHPHGGDPFVVDVHTARDTGMIDQELINHLKRVGYDPEQLDKLEIDLKGSPTEAAYENRAQFGRDLTTYLNNMGWKGRNDWTPAEVQAVGWMGMTKLTRNAEEDSESGLGRNLRRISYELSPGEGSPWAAKYGEAFENLPDEDRYAITQKMADSAMEHAKKLSGINVHSLVHGTGAWENYQNPAAVAQSLSTQRAADIAAATLGHLLQQTEVWHNRIKPIGASPKGFALDFIERGSKNLADPGALRDFWQKVMDADPHGIVKGYQPITLPSGEVGLRALFDKGGAKAQKAIEDLFAPHQVDKKGNIVQKNPFRSMLEEHPFDLDIMGHEAEITKHRNDWKEQKNGEGYLSRLVDLLGYDPSATLNSARQQLEKEFEQHLDEAHKRKGTTWRKAYGGALKAAPVVGAAMKYLSVNSHHDPSSKMRFARSALMIAKSAKKK